MTKRPAAAALAPLVLAFAATSAGSGAAHADGGFAFGSYGRVSAATDGRGGTPEPVTVVAHPPRVVENAYVELELRYAGALPDAGGWTYRTVITPAFLGEPFHYTGDVGATQVMLRNLYAELVHGPLALWVGSRMWRGDDVYLLDWWPLDNLNLLGGGADWRDDRLELRLAGGVNRLLDPYQRQIIQVPDPVFGATPVTQLDRQRGVVAAKAGYRFLGPARSEDGELSAKAALYVEAQSLGAGTREREDDTREDLPSDRGLVVGGEVGLWGFGVPGSASHANLFVRYARGLAASDWLAVPTVVGLDRRTWDGASEWVFGTSTNVELAPGGVILGAYARRFASAAPDRSIDPASGWEAVLDARPYAHIVGPLAAAVDVSWQKRWPNGLSPTTLAPSAPGVFQLAPMLLVTPGAVGSYVRPQLRLVYRAAHLDADARDTYAVDDPRRAHEWVHYLGVQAEWWFNSTSYP
jgi:maltoporin